MFIPKRVFFEQEALDYPLGRQLYERFKSDGIPVAMTGSHNRVTGIPGKTPREAYLEGKRTLVVGVRRTLQFSPCKPSAHYQLPLSTSCTGQCQYCYLNTTLGKKPYVRVYVNVDEILQQAENYIKKRAPEITLFEGAATSDPIPVEPYTGSLARAVEFFGQQPLARFRFVTKFTGVDTLLAARHNGHTRFRFSLNTEHIIKSYEQGTPAARARIAAARRVAQANYPLGFLIAPIFIYPGWQSDYAQLIRSLAEELQPAAGQDITFELISHRFTASAKKRILEVFPDTTLPMEEEERKFKFGQFGYGKYVYPKETLEEMDELFRRELDRHFPGAKVEYLV
ncbi:spore photoproduct lyase [Desulfallas thermosapovorans]|uniref:Spore photoproduct lyase n=1 Tax=Desulfallas thermosapovorans DSM 6562 TaxID=1121431 RepID=A0A5S4ZV98_9FIRM|nr:spore photoproduct lyase [Desulfallas thermosapovorans]TYO96883.1 spore photoproduct lyase [Desulfallas thermosapovorans DSM 6562]